MLKTILFPFLFEGRNIQYYLGEHNISQPYETKTFTTEAADIRPHRKYYNIKSSGLLRYDVGLLELRTQVDFAKYPHIRYVEEVYRL